MSAAFAIIMLLFAVLVPLVLWVAIEGETSNATVMDRTDAERIAKERGGRDDSQLTVPDSERETDSSESSREYTIADRVDDHDQTTGWGYPPKDRGTDSSRGVDRDDGTRDDRHR